MCWDVGSKSRMEASAAAYRTLEENKNHIKILIKI